MVFSSLEFLFFFLPIVLLGYLVVPKRFANFWLMISSLMFYWLGDHFHIKLLLGVILVTYAAGMAFDWVKAQWLRKVGLILTTGLLVALMCYYKYFDFVITNINALLDRDYSLRVVFFPVGVSFFIFQAISYVVDVYRGERPLKNPIDLALYISFFPQLIAGPIVRFKDINEYMDKSYRRLNTTDISEGLWRFGLGLSKKVLLANNLGALADIVFGVHDISKYSVLYTWLGAIAYTLQIYFDFSGYSDMAIGLGRVFGFRFQENFNYPYIASSIKDFWRRWHISLSQFFRDYVYIPLGGNRVSVIRWIANMSCVWLLTGLWHGANWTYILWGVIYGVCLIIERFIPNDRSDKQSKIKTIWGHIYTMMIVTLLWVLFRAEGINQAVDYVKNMFGIGAKSLIDHAFVYQFLNSWLLITVSIVFSLPVGNWLENKIGDKKVYQVGKMIGLAVCTIAAMSFIYMGSYNPFLYFMF